MQTIEDSPDAASASVAERDWLPLPVALPEALALPLPDPARGHNARALRLLGFTAILEILWDGSWSVYYAIAAEWFEAAFCLGVVSVFGVILWQVRRGEVVRATHLAIWGFWATIYASLLWLDAAAPGAPRGTHFWLLITAMLPIVLLPERRSFWKYFYVGASLGGFMAVQTGVAPLPVLHNLPDNLRNVTVPAEILFSLVVLALTLRLLVRDARNAEAGLSEANERLEILMENLLPAAVARRLRADGRSFADGVDECSVLFADIAGFTSYANRETPERVVNLLNGVFTRFDELAERHGLEKIKTIGDAYMVAAGVPDHRADHAQALARFALDMVEVVKGFPGLAVRVGINTGPVVAGVIGKKRFVYDLWGDAVNVASRMEQYGVPGRIQVTEATAKRLEGEFVLEARGGIEVKGKGVLQTFFVLGPRLGS
jgi:adenylate cyclase